MVHILSIATTTLAVLSGAAMADTTCNVNGRLYCGWEKIRTRSSLRATILDSEATDIM